MKLQEYAQSHVRLSFLFILMSSPALLCMEEVSPPSANQSSTEYTDGTTGQLLMYPDPSIPARIERIEKALKERGQTIKKNESINDFVIIIPEQAPFYEQLSVKATSTIKTVPHYGLISCLLALHRCTCALLDEEMRRAPGEAPGYFTNALGWFTDAVGQCEKSQPSLVLSLHRSRAPTQEHLQEPPFFGHGEREHIRQLFTFSDHREVDLFNSDNRLGIESLGQQRKEHAVLVYHALMEFLKECLALKEQNKEAARCCIELGDLLITVTDQCPAVLDWETVTAPDLHAHPVMLFLYTIKMMQLSASFNRLKETNGDADPKIFFSVVKLLLRNKKMITVPNADEEKSTIETLSDKLIVASGHAAITVSDILSLDALLPRDTLLILIIKKLECDKEIAQFTDAVATYQVDSALPQHDNNARPAQSMGMELADNIISYIKKLNATLQQLTLKGKSNDMRQPLILKRAACAALLSQLFEKDSSLLTSTMKQMETILATPECHTNMILVAMAKLYTKETHSFGFELLLGLFERALGLMERYEKLSKTEPLAMIGREELKVLLQDETSYEERKIALEQKRSNDLLSTKKEAEQIAQAVQILIEKAPELISIGLLSVPALRQNKAVLMLLARKLISSPDDGSDRKAQAEALTFRLAELGTSISLTTQTRFAIAQKQMSKKAKSMRKSEEARREAETLARELEELERPYKAMLESLEKMAQNHTKLVHALYLNDSHLTAEELTARLNDIEAACKQDSPIAAHQVEKLRAWQGNGAELLNCAALINEQNPHECTAFALLMNNHLQTGKKQIDQTKTALACARQQHELHTMRTANYEKNLEEFAASRQQAELDRLHIAVTLHALHAQFPQAVSPELLRAYPLAQTTTWSWWQYTPFTLCSVM